MNLAPISDWTATPGSNVKLCFGGGETNRFTRVAELTPGDYSWSFTVEETNGEDGFVIMVGGAGYYVNGSDAPGTYSGTLTSPASNPLIILRAEACTAVVSGLVVEAI